MHNDPDAYQETNIISCSDYRFVYIGAKGLSTYALNYFLSDVDVILSVFTHER